MGAVVSVLDTIVRGTGIRNILPQGLQDSFADSEHIMMRTLVTGEKLVKNMPLILFSLTILRIVTIFS